MLPSLRCLAFGFLAVALLSSAFAEERRPIRVALGGKTTADVWHALAAQFEAATGWKTQLVATGSKEVIADAFQRGEADLLLAHTSDQTAALADRGFGIHPRTWARNELVIVGPASDPAGVRGLHDSAAALRKIAAARAPFVDSYGSGTGELAKKLWQRAHLQAEGAWVLHSASEAPADIAAFATKQQAYALTSRPLLPKQKTAPGELEVLVQGDPELSRPYVVLEANPQKFPRTNATGALALADWLAGDQGQAAILEYGRAQPGGIPLFLPVKVMEPVK